MIKRELKTITRMYQLACSSADKLLHFSFCALISIFLIIVFDRSVAFYVPMLLGLMKELFDEFYYHNFSFGDMFANFLGTIFGMCIGDYLIRVIVTRMVI